MLPSSSPPPLTSPLTWNPPLLSSPLLFSSLLFSSLLFSSLLFSSLLFSSLLLSSPLLFSSLLFSSLLFSSHVNHKIIILRNMFPWSRGKVLFLTASHLVFLRLTIYELILLTNYVVSDTTETRKLGVWCDNKTDLHIKTTHWCAKRNKKNRTEDIQLQVIYESWMWKVPNITPAAHLDITHTNTHTHTHTHTLAQTQRSTNAHNLYTPHLHLFISIFLSLSLSLFLTHTLGSTIGWRHV